MNPAAWLIAAALAAQAPLPEVKDLYIARHGQTEWNRIGRWQGDPDLDPKGYEDRVALFLALQDVPLERIVTSDKQRTRRTAEPIARQRAIRARADADLDEMDGGLLTGLCYSMLDDKAHPPAFAECRAGQAGPTDPRVLEYVRSHGAAREQDKLAARPPGGESYLDGQVRIRRFLRRHRDDIARRTMLVVAHGGTNRILLAELMGWPLASLVRNNQENDWVYRVQRLDDGSRRLSLLRDGTWRACEGPPDPQQGLACAQ
jgi:broad specificity phosphatase PhoE